MCIINIIIDRFQYNRYGKGKRKIYKGELVLICARFTNHEVISANCAGINSKLIRGRE